MSAATLPTWTHRDSDPKAALALAFAAQSYGSPMTTSDRVRIVRTLAIATQYAVENARRIGVQLPSGEMELHVQLGSEVRGNLFPTVEHCYAASTIARTWQLFADPGKHTIHTAVTRDGEPAQLSEDVGTEAGFPPLLLAAVIVVAIAGFTAAGCYAAQTAADVIDRKLTRDALTTRMVVTQARAVALVDNHSEHERAVGHLVPWSPQELQVLDALLGTQKQIAARSDSPLPNPFDGAVEKAGDAGRRLAEGTGMGLGVIAAVAGAAYLLTR